jgi:hypothetical protein
MDAKAFGFPVATSTGRFIAMCFNRLIFHETASTFHRRKYRDFCIHRFPGAPEPLQGQIRLHP